MWKKCKVVMLTGDSVPTYSNKVSKIRLDNKGVLSFEPHIQGLYYDGLDHVYQHLYILSDDEIKEGDWVYNERLGIFQILSKNEPLIGCKKIMATTDSSLNDTSSMFKHLHTKFSSIPQSFIDYYIGEYNKGNMITEVMVEYNGCDCEGKYVPDNKIQDGCGLKLKLNPDNTINIKSIKTSWTRDEVIALISKYHQRGFYESTHDFNKWINDNL